MDTQWNYIPIFLEVLFISFCGYSLLFKTLLPEAYLITALFLGFLIGFQLIKWKGNKFLIFQIIMLGLLLRNIYYLNANYGIIPFDDPNWDYGLVKTFLQEGKVFIINFQGPNVGLLEWYSGWPLLHVLTMMFSMISGIEAFYIALLIPSLISTISSVFVCLFVEKVRKALDFDPQITPIALLIYVVSAETIFWPMQFVHQNLAILFVTITLYLVCLSVTNYKAKYRVLTMVFMFSTVMTHSFSSLVAVTFLIIYSFFSSVGNSLSKTKIGNRFFGTHRLTSIRYIPLASLVFLTIFWDSYGQAVWSHIRSGITRFSEIILGLRKFEILPSYMSYPSLLTPTWGTIFLNLRDVLIYVPTIFGLIFIWFKIRNIPMKFFITYSSLAFGSIFILNYLGFRVETSRIIVLAFPLVVLLSATTYSEIVKRRKLIKKTLILLISIILVFSSFAGLWGHSFVPIHLYNPLISHTEIGDRNTDAMRVNNFFQEKVSIDSYSAVWADDMNPLVFLMESKDYHKIRYLRTDCVIQKSVDNREIFCSFKDLILYSYYARTYSHVGSIQEARSVKDILVNQLAELSRIYDDGKYRVWVNG